MFFASSPRFDKPKYERDPTPAPGQYEINKSTLVKQGSFSSALSSPRSPHAGSPSSSASTPRRFGASQSVSHSPRDASARDGWMRGMMSADGILLQPTSGALEPVPAPGQYELGRIKSVATQPGAPVYSFNRSPKEKPKTGSEPSSADMMLSYSSFEKRSFRNKDVPVNEPRETRADWLKGKVENDVFMVHEGLGEKVGPGAYTPPLDGHFIKPSFNVRARSSGTMTATGASPASPKSTSPKAGSGSPKSVSP